ncbi:MAG: hypothetical protein K0A89_01895 [ANME-2 cluster archaeon]|nr:hypothetical protein [ANME-2 cluster archaeon]
MADIDVYFVFSAVDFIVRLIIVVIFFLIASTLKNSDPDVIRSRLFLEYDRIIISFHLMFVGSIFFFIAAVIEYMLHPVMGDKIFLLMKVSITIFQAVVIYFIATLNKSISPTEKGGM